MFPEYTLLVKDQVDPPGVTRDNLPPDRSEILKGKILSERSKHFTSTTMIMCTISQQHSESTLVRGSCASCH